jgi:hypothetical protein
LYTGVRGAQYVVGAVPAVDRLPADPDVVFVLPDLETTLERWRASPAWESITQRLLKEPAARRAINEALAARGLPTLDQLDDERFLRSDAGKTFSPENLMSLFGRDAAVALRGSESGGGRLFAATRLSFGQFWAAPLVRLAPGLVGASRDASGLRIDRPDGGALWVRFEAGLALASNDPALLAEACDDARRYRPETPPDASIPFVEVRLRSASAAREFDRLVHHFPMGIFAHFVDASACRTARFRLEPKGSLLAGEIELIGARAPDGDAAAALLDHVPEGTEQEGTFSVQPTAATGRELWAWLSGAVAPRAAPGSAMDWAGSDLAYTVGLARDHGFERKVLPLLDGPSLILFGHQPAAHPDALGQHMLAGAVIFQCSDAAAAEAQIDAVLEEIIQDKFVDKGALTREAFGGATLRLVRSKVKYEPLNFVTPCFARVGDTVVVATHDRLLRRILSAAEGTVGRFLPSGRWRGYQKSLAPAGLEEALAPGAVSAGVINLDLFRRSTLVFAGPLAVFQEETAERRSQIRAQIEAEDRRRGLRRGAEQITDEVKLAIKERIARRADALREGLGVLQWLGTAALRAEPTAEGLKVRWALQLYRKPAPE